LCTSCQAPGTQALPEPGTAHDDTLGSASRALCDLLKEIPAFSVGAVKIDKPTCSYTDFDNLYYLGSITTSLILPLPGGHTPPVRPAPQPQRPAAMADALYCALQGADGATADGTFGTAVGTFGVQSRLAVTTKDAPGRHVAAQRLGRLFAFGVGMDLESQDVNATFPIESAGATVFLRQAGYYMDLTTSTAAWQMGGGGTIPVVPPLSLHLQFGQSGNFGGENNDAIAFSPRAGANQPNPDLSWQHLVDGCNACRAGGAVFCDCPSAAETTAHNQTANFTDAQYRNLSDRVLPYVAQTGGVTGNYVYRDASKNWFHFGQPDGAITGPQDPVGKGHPTTNFDLQFGLDYDIIALILDLGVDYRSGFELVQGSEFENEFKNHYATVGTALDAEGHAKLGAHLIVRNPFPFGPSVLIDETFSIFENSHASHTQPSAVRYDYAQGYPFATYATPAGPAGNAEAARMACLAAPPVHNPPVAPQSPQQFVQMAANEAHQQLYPCHVKLCAPQPNVEYYGKERDCEWNRQAQRLDCRDTGVSCRLCQQSVELCDAAGNVYQPLATARIFPCPIQ
jgi:hypothetical protein